MKLRKILSPLLVVVVTFGVVLGVWYWRSPESTKIKVGQLAPDLRLPLSASGRRVSLSDFRGEPVLLVMFLSGCHVCEEEIEEVEAIHRVYGPQGLTVLGLSVDPDDPTRRRFIRRHELSFFVLADKNGAVVREAFGSYRFPEAYLLDAEGRVAHIFLGSVRWRSEGRARIKELLPKEPRKR